MKLEKWSVSRFKSNSRFSYPAGKFRFETKLAANIAKKVFQIEALLTNSPRPYISYIPEYSIDTNLDVSYGDIGQWRSYHLDTSGDNLKELLDNANISEIDQDGGDIDNYGLNECSTEVENEVLSIIYKKIAK